MYVTIAYPSIDGALVYYITASEVIVHWTVSEGQFIPSNGYRGILTCSNSSDCDRNDTEYNSSVTNLSSSLTITLDPGDYITDNCSLTLYGLYGDEEYPLVTTMIEGWHCACDTLYRPSSCNLSFIFIIGNKVIPPPSTVKTYAITSTSIVLSWEWYHCIPPSIDGYLITYTNSSDYTGTVNITSPTNTSDNITELTPFTTYYITIAGYNIIKGTGLWSTQLNATTLESVPSAVVNLTSYGSDVDEVTVQWREPQSPNGIILGYVIHRLDDNVTMNMTLETHVIITELEYNHTYCIKVAAMTSAGIGEGSNTTTTTKSIGMNIYSVTGLPTGGRWDNLPRVPAAWGPCCLGPQTVNLFTGEHRKKKKQTKQ